MTKEIGTNLEWVKTMSLVQPNLTWFATYTLSTIHTHTISRAPAAQRP